MHAQRTNGIRNREWGPRDPISAFSLIDRRRLAGREVPGMRDKVL